MNEQIKKLSDIAQKETRRIIGLMSGTSLDGLDIALCRLSNSGSDTLLEVEKHTTVLFTDTFRNELRSLTQREHISLQQVAIMNVEIGRLFAQYVNKTLQDWKIPHSSIDIIASHGQTVYHAPRRQHKNPSYTDATFQIGEGDQIASRTGIITLSDFRQKHIAAGGEGAPLAPYGDYLLFSESSHDVLLINIGGIANFTLLPAKKNPGPILYSDTGPGNTLMDNWMRTRYPEQRFDSDGAIARKGNASETLLQHLLAHEFFRSTLPKSTGPEIFHLMYVKDAIECSGQEGISFENVMATLNQLSAQSICDCVETFLEGSSNPFKIYISGGGIYNTLLMETIEKRLRRNHVTFHSTMEKGLHPDAKEAALFAVLANECLAGTTHTFKNGTLGLPPVTMGKISLPY